MIGPEDLGDAAGVGHRGAQCRNATLIGVDANDHRSAGSEAESRRHASHSAFSNPTRLPMFQRRTGFVRVYYHSKQKYMARAGDLSGIPPVWAGHHRSDGPPVSKPVFYQELRR